MCEYNAFINKEIFSVVESFLTSVAFQRGERYFAAFLYHEFFQIHDII